MVWQGVQGLADLKSKTAITPDTVFDIASDRENTMALRKRVESGEVPGPRILTVGWLAGRLSGRSLGVLVVQQGPSSFAPLADLCMRGEVSIHVHHAYRLDPVDAAWVPMGTERTASFAHLPAGRYTLRVRAGTASGAWSPHELRLPLATGAG